AQHFRAQLGQPVGVEVEALHGPDDVTQHGPLVHEVVEAAGPAAAEIGGAFVVAAAVGPGAAGHERPAGGADQQPGARGAGGGRVGFGGGGMEKSARWRPSVSCAGWNVSRSIRGSCVPASTTMYSGQSRGRPSSLVTTRPALRPQ